MANAVQPGASWPCYITGFDPDAILPVTGPGGAPIEVTGPGGGSVDVNLTGNEPTFYQGTVSASGVVTGLTAIDGSVVSVIEFQHRGTLGQFKFTIAVEGTDDPTADGATDAAGTKGWTALEVRSATGGEMSSIVLGGRYLLFNPARKIRVRCTSYTYGSAQIDVMAKPMTQEDPSRTVSDKDALASLAMTTFGQLQVAQRTFLAGGNFDETSLDTDVWEDINANGGTHAFANGVIELHSGTSATGKGGVRSFNLANVLGAADNVITIREAVGATTNGKYVHRFGVFTSLEGAFIQYSGNGRTLTDAVFNGTTTMTSAAGDFTAADLGKRVDSTGNVTIGTTIVRIDSSTQVTLSAAALTSASAQTVVVEGFSVTFVTRKAGVDTTSPFGVIGFAAVTANTALQLWEITFNPNFLIIRNSSNFVQLQIGSTVLSAMFNQYDLPLVAEVENLGSTTDHTLFLQTLVAERLGQPSSIRANEAFKATDVLNAGATVIHGFPPDFDDAPETTRSLAVRVQGVHTLGSTTTPLPGDTGGDDHVWRGKWFAWQEHYLKAAIDIDSDVPGTGYIDYSQEITPVDGTDESISRFKEIPFSPDRPSEARHTVIQSKWVRSRYVNGVAAQSRLSVDMAMLTADPGLGMKPANVPMDRGSLTGMVDAVTTSRAEESADNSEDYVQDRATLNADTGKRGKNSHITGLDVAVDIKALPNMLDTGRFTASVTNPVQLPAPTVANPKTVQIQNLHPDNIGSIGSLANVLGGQGDALLPQIPYQYDYDGQADRPYIGVDAGTPPLSATTDRFGTGTANVSGVTNASNINANDAAFAIFDTVAETLDITGITAAGTFPSIANVSVAFKGRKGTNQTTEQVSFIGSTAITGNAGAVGSVVSGSVTGGTPLTGFIAYISRESTSATNGDVSSVTGLGLTWTQVTTKNSDDDNRRLDCWKAFGTATTGTVTANFATNPSSSHIAILPIYGASSSSMIQASGSTAANSASVSGPALSGTDRGMSIMGVAIDNTTSTAGSGYTERSDEKSSSGTIDGLTTITKQLTATGSETATCTLANAKHYAAISVTITPAAAYDPVMRVRTKVGGTISGTVCEFTLSSTTNGEATIINITGDRSWTAAVIADTDLVVDLLSMGAAQAEPDSARLSVTETEETATIPVSYMYIGGGAT